MKVQDYENEIAKVRKMVQNNRPLWYRMDRAGIASYRYFVKLACGDVAQPSVQKLVAIQDYLKANGQKQAAA